MGAELVRHPKVAFVAFTGSKAVGLDLVEVSPPYDWAEVTARSGARLLLDVLAAIFAKASARRSTIQVGSEEGRA